MCHRGRGTENRNYVSQIRDLESDVWDVDVDADVDVDVGWGPAYGPAF